MIKHCTAIEDVCELMLKEQFTSILYKDLQIWIKERSPDTAKEARQDNWQTSMYNLGREFLWKRKQIEK